MKDTVAGEEPGRTVVEGKDSKTPETKKTPQMPSYMQAGFWQAVGLARQQEVLRDDALTHGGERAAMARG